MGKKNRDNRRTGNSRTDNHDLIPENFRELAFVILREYTQKGIFLSDSLNDWDRKQNFDRTMIRQAQELAFGTVRRSGTLRHLLEKNLSRPLKDVEEELQLLLQLGMYQIFFMDSVPDHAAVNETVELSKKLKKKNWVRFINGILRNLTRSISNETASLPDSFSMPLSKGKFLTFKSALFSDPQSDFVEYFKEAYSFPKWLSERWADQYSQDKVFALGDWFNSVHPITLRANCLKISRDELMDLFRENGIEVSAGDEPEAIHLLGSSYIQGLPGFDDGLFMVQDQVAMKASRLLNPKTGENILDICAAPGTKTGHIAELMNNQGSITACDVSSYRLKQIEENISRMDYSVIETIPIQKDGSDIPSGPFDAILIDAPCSNTGVMGKRPESRWRIKESDISELVEIQKKLLLLVSENLTPDGRIVYSTCSMEPEENENMVAWFLGQKPEFFLIREQKYLPGKPADGGYQALLIRKV
jgi:16S rRNA (cytosine967-C5)-methyltransferase